MADAKKLVPFILKWEGGFANVKGDHGGATNKGITISTFRQFYGQNKTVDDLKNMTQDEWYHIFKVGFWDRYKADQINNQSIANILVDWIWASGKWGIIKLQEAMGLTADGIVGPKTISAINSRDQRYLFGVIKYARINFIKNLVKGNPSQTKFEKGWLRRINDFNFY